MLVDVDHFVCKSIFKQTDAASTFILHSYYAIIFYVFCSFQNPLRMIGYRYVFWNMVPGNVLWSFAA
jgi:hypothetical protein